VPVGTANITSATDEQITGLPHLSCLDPAQVGEGEDSSLECAKRDNYLYELSPVARL
jgi:hypothetical protein